jgi:hypothetical protein
MMYTMCKHYIPHLFARPCIWSLSAFTSFDGQKNIIRLQLRIILSSAEWVTDMGLIKYFDVLIITILGTVQES